MENENTAPGLVGRKISDQQRKDLEIELERLKRREAEKDFAASQSDISVYVFSAEEIERRMRVVNKMASFVLTH